MQEQKPARGSRKKFSCGYLPNDLYTVVFQSNQMMSTINSQTPAPTTRHNLDGLNKAKDNGKGSSMQKQLGKEETTIREAVVNGCKGLSTV